MGRVHLGGWPALHPCSIEFERHSFHWRLRVRRQRPKVGGGHSFEVVFGQSFCAWVRWSSGCRHGGGEREVVTHPPYEILGIEAAKAYGG